MSTGYRVRTTAPIAKEMALYEGNEILSQSDPQVDPDFKGDPELEAMYTTWDFKISGNPNVRRWKSFGVVWNR